MRRAFGFHQQSYGMHQEAQHQSYSMHQEAAWNSKNDYHNHISGVQIAPSLCLDSQFINHHAMFDGSHALHDGLWHAQNMNQNGWSNSVSGSSTSGAFCKNHIASGTKKLPLVSVMNVSQLSHGGGAMFNNAMENGGYETVQEVVHVPATMRVQEMRYERSSWGGGDDGFQYCHGFDDNARWKRNGYWKAEWITRGA